MTSDGKIVFVKDEMGKNNKKQTLLGSSAIEWAKALSSLLD